jgi:polyhydroxyalkanoate synthesis regulator phasin
MRLDDCRIEWRINDVENKAEQAVSRIYEIDEARRNVDSLERSLRESRSEIDGLRSRLQACEDRIRQIEER